MKDALIGLGIGFAILAVGALVGPWLVEATLFYWDFVHDTAKGWR